MRDVRREALQQRKAAVQVVWDLAAYSELARGLWYVQARGFYKVLDGAALLLCAHCKNAR